MPGVLDRKVAVVTGGGSGIGRATAVAMAREGAAVIVADVAAEGAQATVSTIRESGGRATCVEADVSRTADVERLIATAVDGFGRLDCAFNNAGVGGPIGSTHEVTEEAWARVLAVNLTGVWLCMKHELSQMLRQGGSGAIINTASVAGLVGGTSTPYAASKHGIVGLTKNAALEYAARGIRINAVCPGVVMTPMVAGAFASRPGLEERWRAAAPIGRFAAPEEVASAVVWLCSEAASYVTGVALPVDGGWVAQ
jgi:NAD(P)-dependent dehydrogenase (short-subunit alcohol dehydrogenase family)